MKKIMFNDKFQLTNAVLEGRKTQTRRIVPKDFFSLTWDEKNGTLWYENSMGDFIDVRNSKYALYKVCEVVAVAQSYKTLGYNYDALDISPKDFHISRGILGKSKGWNNKMFVRAEACKHKIRITDVRVEKLQEISDDDCLKEGVVVNEPKIKGGINMYYPCEYLRSCAKEVGWGRVFHTPREAFAHLINKVSRKDVWQENPYVFVYDFELVK